MLRPKAMLKISKTFPDKLIIVLPYNHLVFCPKDCEGEVMVVLSDEELSDEDNDESQKLY
jgi:hypothetical protein